MSRRALRPEDTTRTLFFRLRALAFAVLRLRLPSEEIADELGGYLVIFRDGIDVQLDRNRKIRMPESGLNRLRVNAVGKQLCRLGVTKLMKLIGP